MKRYNTIICQFFCLNREPAEDDEAPTDNLYTIEFTFDSEARTAITIYFFASEEVHGGHAR